MLGIKKVGQVGQTVSHKLTLCSVLKRVIGALHCDNADHYVHNVYRYNRFIHTCVCIQEQIKLIIELVLTVLGISKFAG